MNESKYFFRKVVYVQQEGTAALVTNFNPIQTNPLEPWMSLIFLMADGLHTIDQLHKHLFLQYNGKAPNDYKKTVESVVNRLVEAEVIGLSEEVMQLPPYLITSFDKQDQKASMKEMLEDGYLTASVD